MPEAIVALGETKRIVGRLRFESEGRRQHSQFEYDENWLGWEDMKPLSDLAPPIPRLVDLERLRALSAKFERDPGGADAEARDLAGIAGSLGGARPKANVEGDGHFWIAKFTSERDTKPIERAEVATLKLAEACGLHVAHARLELAGSDHPIALIQRFDRRGNARIPYISARTALQWQRQEGAYYTDIADVIRQISGDPLSDLRELWRRMLFTILVSNSDDHLKNHGLLYAISRHLRLIPSYTRLHLSMKPRNKRWGFNGATRFRGLHIRVCANCWLCEVRLSYQKEPRYLFRDFLNCNGHIGRS